MTAQNHICEVCKWSNCNVFRYTFGDKQVLMCPGCVQRELQKQAQLIADCTEIIIRRDNEIVDLKRKPWPMAALIAFLNTFIWTVPEGSREDACRSLERDCAKAKYPVKWDGRRFNAWGRRSWIIGKLCIGSCLQGQGARIVDRCTSHTVDGIAFGGWCIRPPFTKHRPVRSLVLTWRRPQEPPGDCQTLQCGEGGEHSP